MKAQNAALLAPTDMLLQRARSSAGTSTSSMQHAVQPSDPDPSALLLDDDDPSTLDPCPAPPPLAAHDALRLAFCGGTSGAFSKTCTAPLARLTILYQVQALEAPSGRRGAPGLSQALRHVVRTEGWLSLWKGNMVTILHRVPYSATNFTVYEWSKKSLERTVRNDAARQWAAGAMSGLVACTAAYPLDLLRTRMAAETTTARYRQLAGSLRRIVAEEGPLGLYKGLGATLMQVVPCLAFNFCFYDSFKALAAPQPGQRPSPATAAACACASGLCTSTLTFPLDVVRRRMQVYGQGTRSNGMAYLEAWRHIFREGGMRAFYRGIVPEYCKVVPGMGIAFTTYEALKRFTAVPV